MQRTLMKLGGSLGLTLPMDWVKENNLQAGDRVEVRYGNNLVTILPREAQEATKGDSKR